MMKPHKFITLFLFMIVVVMSHSCSSSFDGKSSAQKSLNMNNNLDSLLENIASISFENYNPETIILAVNLLQMKGKEEALNELDTFLNKSNKIEYPIGFFWTLRVLFDLPPNIDYPPVKIGDFGMEKITNMEEIGRFPIVIVEDIPFLVAGGYLLRGLPESVDNHIVFFREHGIIRNEPISLPEPKQLDVIQEEFLKIWTNHYGGHYLDQVLNLVKKQIACLR